MSETRTRGVFITGTDTGIGKTWIGCGLMAALQARSIRVAGMKPIASGCEQTPEGLRNEDALRLQALASMPLPYSWVNPYAFEPAIAPHIAARETGVELDFGPMLEAAHRLAGQSDYLVIEGVGGWRVPLGKGGDVAALARALGLPVVMVIGVRLGCLNHGMLTAEAIANDGLSLAGWVANLIDPAMDHLEDNLQTLKEAIAAPCLGVVPYHEQYRPEALGNYLNVDFLLTTGSTLDSL